MRIASIFFILLLIVCGNSYGAERKKSGRKAVAKSQEVKQKPSPSATVSQGEFARDLIEVLGWGNGIPKVVVNPKDSKVSREEEDDPRDPTDRDYLVVLQGKRSFKFEAEDIYNSRTDGVSIRKFELYGPFSGKSWLGGVTTPVTVHFRVFIPFDGEYRISASTKGDGQIWKIDGKEYRIDTGGRFTLKNLATLPLKAGLLKIEMTMPPEGGIDYLTFTAPDFNPIEPLGGWRFSEPLTNTELAEITASLLGWEERLPVNLKGPIPVIVASELAGLPAAVKQTDEGILGSFNSKKWIRAGAQGADIDIPITLQETGVYSLKIRAVGEPVKAVLDGMPMERAGKPYFEWFDFGLHRLAAGSHSLLVSIPMYGGLDVLMIEPRQSDPASYLKLVGITDDPRTVLTHGEKEKFLTKLLERFTTRK